MGSWPDPHRENFVSGFPAALRTHMCSETGDPVARQGDRVSDLLLCCAPGRIRTGDTHFRSGVEFFPGGARLS